MKTLKTNLTYLLSAAIGVLTFVLFAIPYLSIYASLLGNSASEGINGYQVLDLWDSGFAGVMSSLLQVLVLVSAIALLAFGACGLLKAFGILKAFPETLGGIESKKIAHFGLIGYAILNALLLVFLIIFTSSNSDGNELISAGVSLSAGIFVTLVLAIGAAVTPVVVEKLSKKAAPAAEEAPTATEE